MGWLVASMSQTMMVWQFPFLMQTKVVAIDALPHIWLDSINKVCHHHRKIAVVGSWKGNARGVLTAVTIGRGDALGSAFEQ